MMTGFDVHILKFGLTGLSGMCIDFIITWLSKEKIKLNKYPARSSEFCCAVINNFLVNHYWTFENYTQTITEQFLKFALVSVSGLAISNRFLYLLLKYLRGKFYIHKVVVTCIVFL